VPNEISAGGVLVRRMQGRWWLAAIRPQGKPEGVWALPKGLVDQGERADATALREVYEETGSQVASTASSATSATSTRAPGSGSSRW
jgi:ADP-ribose pyrophosphatase YjhB (NUDIX family)